MKSKLKWNVEEVKKGINAVEFKLIEVDGLPYSRSGLGYAVAIVREKGKRPRYMFRVALVRINMYSGFVVSVIPIDDPAIMPIVREILEFAKKLDDYRIAEKSKKLKAKVRSFLASLSPEEREFMESILKEGREEHEGI